MTDLRHPVRGPDRPGAGAGAGAATDTGLVTALSGSTGRAAVIMTVTNRAEASEEHLRGLPADVSGLEIRADLAGEVDVSLLRRHFRGTLSYSLRSKAAGGFGENDPQHRRERLLAAARHYDVVDLEAERDLEPSLLAGIPPWQRRIAWHGRALALAPLRERFAWMAQVPARLYLLGMEVNSCEQALPALRLLSDLRRPDVTAFGTGRAGTWSRLLAPWLGAPVLFGRPGAAEVHGVPSVTQLLNDYPYPDLPPLRHLYGIVGKNLGSSMSPRLHNAAYRTLGLPSLFLPFHACSLTRFWYSMATSGLDDLGLPLRGVTVVSPHKAAALAVADLMSPACRAAGSANAMVRRAGGWRAETTDTTAIVAAVRRARPNLDGRKAAVIGCGGAGRAAAVGLMSTGADVTLVNRSGERGQFAANLLGLPFVPLSEFSPSGYSVVVHATPVSDEELIRVEDLADDAIILELVYRSQPTTLVTAARRRGLPVIDGWEVLTMEVTRQFRLMTGRAMPEQRIRGT